MTAMSNGATGGVFANLADLQASRPREDTVVQLTNGAKYKVVGSNTGANLPFENGNFAEPIAPVTPFHFGAVGDGLSNDFNEVTSAINFAASNGLVFSGESKDKPFGVSGNINLPENSIIRDFGLKQLDPDGATNRRTLTSSNTNNLDLKRVVVDINGDGTNGNRTDYAGVWLVGGSGHSIADVEIKGDMIGRGFFMVNATDFVIHDVRVHDINYSVASDPGDDRIDGFSLQGCSNFIVNKVLSYDLGGDFGSGQTTRYTRGASYTGNENFVITNYKANNVGQGSDLTGGVNNGNVNFSYTASQVSNCYSWGFKFSNSANTGTIGNLTARDCGLGSFVVEGGSGGESQSWISKDIQFNNCISINAGSNGNWTNPRGFRVSQGSTDANTPFGVKFIGCKAIDENGTTGTITGATQANPCVITSTGHGLSTGMYVSISGVVGMTELNHNDTNNTIFRVTVLNSSTFELDGVDSSSFAAYTSGGAFYGSFMVDGFFNEVTAQTGRLNECIDCESVGHVFKSYNGMHFPSLSGLIAADQSVNTGATTEVNINNSIEDSSSMRNGTSQIIRKDGLYSISATNVYETNSTGIRRVRLNRNGGQLVQRDFEAKTGSETVCSVEVTKQLEAGDIIALLAFQDSGSTLNLKSGLTSINITRIQ